MNKQGRAMLGVTSAVITAGIAGLAAGTLRWSVTITCGLLSIVFAIITAPVIAANEAED